MSKMVSEDMGVKLRMVDFQIGSHTGGWQTREYLRKLDPSPFKTAPTRVRVLGKYKAYWTFKKGGKKHWKPWGLERWSNLNRKEYWSREIDSLRDKRLTHKQSSYARSWLRASVCMPNPDPANHTAGVKKAEDLQENVSRRDIDV